MRVDMEIENEVWKDVIGYEGFYQVSNKGNVKVLDRYIKYPNGFSYKRKGHAVKVYINTSGYPYCHFSKNNKRKLMFIHRLVAEHFIPNPKNFNEVNHIDGNKLNFDIKNLEWIYKGDNLIHAMNTGLRKRSYSSDEHLKVIRFNSLQKRKRSVRALNPITNKVEYEFDLLKDASVKFSCDSHAITRAITNHKIFKGYLWEDIKCKGIGS